MTQPTMTAPNTTASVGERLARSIAANDRSGLLGLLAPDLDFRAVTPSRCFELRSADEAVDVILGRWFGGDRRIDAVERIETDVVVDCERVGYRFRATTPAGPSIVEQQAYVIADNGTITALRIVCSGFRPLHD